MRQPSLCFTVWNADSRSDAFASCGSGKVGVTNENHSAIFAFSSSSSVGMSSVHSGVS